MNGNDARKKTSLIWEFFREDENDYSNAICLTPGCKKPIVSRGKTGAGAGAGELMLGY